uniref:Uncharacterized protein n=1 Tax=Anopheles culicifacies TaxID=139723 RepID=A0A182MK89_9DIPT
MEDNSSSACCQLPNPRAEYSTYQCWHRVARAVAGPLTHGGDLFARKLARFDVGLQYARQQTGLIVQFAREGPLVAAVLCALLHRGQYAGLFPFRHPPKPDGCLV